ncbi:MAG TPA: alginate export family protein [Fimbriimonadaceae bacterium]|nr:alginate export family protein [Fimbriimonadaceae bacterium]
MLTDAPLDVSQDWKIAPSGEVRLRYERRVDKDFLDDANDNRSDLFWRFRPGVVLTGPKGVKITLQVQAFINQFWTPGRNASTQGYDVFLANVEMPVADGKLTLGRQRFGYFDQRLLGSRDWGNKGSSWDMVRFVGPKVDAFAGKLAVGRRGMKDQYLAAVVAKHGKSETSVVYKHDKLSGGDVNIGTLIHNGTLSKDKWTLGYEGAVQFGRSEGKDLLAWSGAVKATWALSPRFKASGVLEVASGGSGESTTRLFDDLAYANHDQMGITDMQGFRNVIHAGLTGEVTVNPQWRVVGRASHFWLYDKTDGWYDENGALNRRRGGFFIDPTGDSGRDLGTEVSIEAFYTPVKNQIWRFGCGVFLPGNFVKNMNDGTARNQFWLFAQYTYRF